MIHELSREDARRIAIRAQLLGSTRPTDLLDMVRHITLLQYDQTAAVVPNADLVAWSRLGSSYSPDELSDALAGRALIELQGMIRPSEDIALYRAEMRQWADGELTGWRKSTRNWLDKNEACRRDILERLASEGPLTSREIPDTCAVPWKSTGWNNDRNIGQMLDIMSLTGDVAVTGRRGRDRLWDLAERVYPDDPVVPADEAQRTRNELRLRSLGIVRPRGPECPVEQQDVGDAGEPAVIENVRGQWRVDPDQLGQPFAGRVAIISPLDRSIFDRKRMDELFGFDYQLEMYKPAAKRRWGYFALPILDGDQFVGKVDATTDRKAGVLRVDAIHEDVAFSRSTAGEVEDEIKALAAWLELDLVLTR